VDWPGPADSSSAANRSELSIHWPDAPSATLSFSTGGKRPVTSSHWRSPPRKPHSTRVCSPPPPWTMRARPPSAGLDQFVGADGGQADGAGERVGIVARQHDDVSGNRLDRRLGSDLQHQPPGADVMVGDDAARRRRDGAAVLRPHPGGDAPRGGEFGIEKDAA
jgi:hypothetical protein